MGVPAPGTLDGVSVTFAFLAFRAVRRRKAPDRSYRVVWGAAIASATVNFAYEYTDSGHNLVAGGYLALLSLFGMVMFHEFLDQFEEGTADIRRANPRFGLSWLTWPTNTFCATVAWHNHPPADNTPATIRNAVANLDRVRALKHEAKEAAIVARHQRAIAQARRKTELAAATAAVQSQVETGAEPVPAVNGEPAEPQPIHFAPTRVMPAVLTPTTPSARPAHALPRVDARVESGGTEVRVPATAATLAQ